MRLISQDGMIDVPYEQASIEVNGRDIYCGYSSIITRHCTGRRFAEYSSKAKVLKVMEMLRNAYCGKVIFQNVTMGEDVLKLMNEWKMQSIISKTDSEPRIEYINNNIFVFPKDLEVEV